METLKIIKEADSYSEIVGITPMEAKKMRAILMAAFWVRINELAPKIESKVNTNLLFEFMLEETIARLDTSKPSVAFYLGFKFQEIVDQILNPSGLMGLVAVMGTHAGYILSIDLIAKNLMEILEEGY